MAVVPSGNFILANTHLSKFEKLTNRMSGFACSSWPLKDEE